MVQGILLFVFRRYCVRILAHSQQSSRSNPASAIAIFDDQHPSVKYEAGWVTGGTSWEFNGTTTGSKIAGSSAKFSFNGELELLVVSSSLLILISGTSLKIYGTYLNDNVKDGGEQKMSFDIDGGQDSGVFTLPLSPQGEFYHFELFSSKPLDPGNHTLTITQLSSTLDSWHIFLDYFLVSPDANGTSVDLEYIVDDTDSKIEYSGSGRWINGAGAGLNIRNSIHRIEADGQMKFDFEGMPIFIFHESILLTEIL